MAHGYAHKQRGTLHFACGLAAGGFLAAAIWAGADDPFFAMHISLSALFLFLSGCFIYLHVYDEGDSLSIRFGPIMIFGTRIGYDEIASVAVSRTTFWDGVGVHSIPFVRAVFNIRMGACVLVTLKKPCGLLRVRHIKIGTDQPQRLADFLTARVLDVQRRRGHRVESA